MTIVKIANNQSDISGFLVYMSLKFWEMRYQFWDVTTEYLSLMKMASETSSLQVCQFSVFTAAMLVSLKAVLDVAVRRMADMPR